MDSNPQDSSRYELIIVGGGPAGLSAALTAGRMGRNALVCDDGRPRNAPATQVHNLPSQDGIATATWRAHARRDLQRYSSVVFEEQTVRHILKTKQGFVAELSSGTLVTAEKVILAYGIEDRLLPIPGIRELWGRKVFHCPYCHGHELRDMRLGLIANGAAATHMLPLLWGLAKDLVLFTHGPAQLEDSWQNLLRQRGVWVVETEITRLISSGFDAVSAILADQSQIELDGVFAPVPPPFSPRSDIGEKLGCEKTSSGVYRVTDGVRTTVPGVFAAGDICAGQHSVVGACAAGQTAASMVVSELLEHEFMTA